METLHQTMLRIITPVHDALGRFIQRASMKDPSLFPPRGLDKAEALAHLYRVAYGDPGRYVCEACVQLHPVSLTDAPGILADTTCPHDIELVSTLPVGPASHCSWKCITLPRHVKMTPKYTRLHSEGRLDHTHRQHLQSLLTPRCYISNTSCTSNGLWDASKPRVSHAVQSFIHDNIYWIKGVYLYHETNLGGPVSTKTLGVIRMCEHQFFNFDAPDWRERPMSLLCMLVEQALEAEDGKTFQGNCEWCQMTFKIRNGNSELSISYHKRIGHEGMFERGICMCAGCHRPKVEAKSLVRGDWMK